MAVHGERVEPADVVAFIRDMVECPTFKPLIKSLLNDQLGPITDTAGCPIRIAWGERDRLIPYRHFGPPMCERVPVAEFRTLPGVGHVPMPDDPALVARTILEVTRAADAGELST
jgi:pimeloyl-ACP methyl ester carboxylesterase